MIVYYCTMYFYYYELFNKTIDENVVFAVIHPRFFKQNVITTLPPAYLSNEFAFHVRFQRIERALSLNCV